MAFLFQAFGRKKNLKYQPDGDTGNGPTDRFAPPIGFRHPALI